VEKSFVLLNKVEKMSNLTKQSIRIPNNINVKLKKNLLFVEGPLGTKILKLPLKTLFDPEKNEIIVTNKLLPELSKKRDLESKILQGGTHSILKRIILGLSVGFRKQLNIVGVGYKASIENEKDTLILKLGYSHQIFIKIPIGIKVNCIKPTKISIFGNNKQAVNQMATIIRSYKIPEPYKGKGILYQNEKINKKEGKRT
jgi:large subunit ribosomal protein L6